MPKKKKTRVVLREKVHVPQAMRLVDRPSTHSRTNPRAVELSGRDDAAPRADSGGQMISRCTVSRAGIPRKSPVTYSAPAERQVGERAACSAAWVHIGNPG